MISQSHIWKDDLERQIFEIRQMLRHVQREERELTEDEAYRLERFLFISSFIMRKLLDAGKLSDEMKGESVPVVVYPRKHPETAIWWSNNHHLDYFYDLENGLQRRVGLQDITSIFIHTFVLMTSYESATDDEGNEGYEEGDESPGVLTGFLVNSEKIKDKELLAVALEDFLRLADKVVKDDVVFIAHETVTGRTTRSRRHPLGMGRTS